MIDGKFSTLRSDIANFLIHFSYFIEAIGRVMVGMGLKRKNKLATTLFPIPGNTIKSLRKIYFGTMKHRLFQIIYVIF